MSIVKTTITMENQSIVNDVDIMRFAPAVKDVKPLLNVFVLTYNHETTIAKTLDSILEQKTTYPFIITILEDASTDNTLAICKKYVRCFPNKIKLVAQPVNTKGMHSLWAKKKITTKYWCTLEGDDYWCDNSKIQHALDILENFPKFVAFAHDTLCHTLMTGKKYSLRHNSKDLSLANTGKSEIMSYESCHYIHTSAIIYRHVVNFSSYNLPLIDTYIFFYHLSFGPIFYIDKIMSVHLQTGKGMWSSLSDDERKFKNEEIHYTLNRYFKFNFDKFFSNTVCHKKQLKRLKFVFGVALGWKVYIFMRKFRFYAILFKQKRRQK